MTKQYIVPDDYLDKSLAGNVYERDDDFWWKIDREAVAQHAQLNALHWAGKLEELEEEKPWPQEGDIVWVKSHDGEIYQTEYDDEDGDIFARDHIYRTKDAAEAADRVAVAKATIARYAREKWGEWRFKPGKTSHSLWFDHVDKTWNVQWVEVSQHLSTTYYAEQTHAQEIIDKFRAELDIIRKGGVE